MLDSGSATRGGVLPSAGLSSVPAEIEVIIAAPGATTIVLPDAGRRPGPGTYGRWAKPVLDVVGALVLLVLVAPVLAVVALMVRAKLGRGVLFRQQRIGRDGRPFTVLKFRTMLPDRRRAVGSCEPGWEGTCRRRSHKSAHDPRHTPLGRALRCYGLDELPQLVNVLRGEMSLVGPRPELPSVVARYEPWQHRRHRVRPGLTGLWQVTSRGKVPMHEATQLDLDYVDRLSLRTDLAILVRTVWVLLVVRSGA